MYVMSYLRFAWLLCGTSCLWWKCIYSYKCERIREGEKECFGMPLDYDNTTTGLVTDSKNQDEVKAKLKQWEGLKFIPNCWEVLQPLLCQVYKPRCDKKGNVSLPCQEQCLATRKPCSVVERYNKEWPEFLKCENFPKKGCNGTVKRLKLNESACRLPLVETEHKSSWYEGIEGCGIQCENPIFTPEEHARIHRFVAAFGFLSFSCTFFTMITFLIGWKSQNRYPSVILFYMNSCFCVASLGFLLQFIGGARKLTVCRKDNTMRLQEPSEDDSGFCIVTFVFVYYCSLAGTLWFVILAYSWSICFKNLGSTVDNFVGKAASFHLTAWFIPTVLAAGVLSLREVDANSLSGICMVGYKNPHMRGAFLLGPLGVALIVGGFFLAKGLITLFKLRKSNPDFLGSRSSVKIKETIIRVGLFAFIAFAFIFTTFACHMYEYSNQKLWEDSYMQFIQCVAQQAVQGKSWQSHCSVSDRPDLSIIELELSSLFGAGIAMSSWTWTSNTLKTWKKMWHRITRKRRYPMLSHYRFVRRNNRVGPAAAAAGAAAVLPFPAIPEAQMLAIMKAGATIQDLGTKANRCVEEPLKLQSASSEFTPACQLRIASYKKE